MLGALLFALFFHLHVAYPTEKQERAGQDSSATRLEDSSAAEFRTAVASLSTPELKRRNAMRRMLQRQTYTEILEQSLRDDGLGALLAYLKGMLQLEFSLPRNTLYYYVPMADPAYRDTLPGTFFRASSGPFVIPLPEDRSFPEDPWKE